VNRAITCLVTSGVGVLLGFGEEVITALSDANVSVGTAVGNGCCVGIGVTGSLAIGTVLGLVTFTPIKITVPIKTMLKTTARAIRTFLLIPTFFIGAKGAFTGVKCLFAS